MTKEIDIHAEILPANALRSERGAVLILTVVLSAIALAVMVTMLYMVTVGTQTGRAQGRMRTAYEAALAGWDIMRKAIDTRGDSAALGTLEGSLDAAGLNAYFNYDASCMGSSITGGSTATLEQGFLPVKIKTATSTWINCLETLPVDLYNKLTYDLSLVLGTDIQYNVYGKIKYTEAGNTSKDADDRIDLSGGVIKQSSRAEVASVSTLYTVEILATGVTNTRERAKLTIVYQY